MVFNNEQKDNFALTDSFDKEPMSESELLFSANAPPIVSKFNNDKGIYKNQILNEDQKRMLLLAGPLSTYRS